MSSNRGSVPTIHQHCFALLRILLPEPFRASDKPCAGGDNANATAAGACSSQQIVVAVAAANAGAASGPVDVTCAPLSPPPAEVLGHIATTFDGSDLTGLAAFPRRLQRAAANALELLSAAAPAGVPVPANISAAGTLEPCSTRGQPAVTADVQCQGVAEDVCACVGDAVRCVPAGTGLVTLPGFVTADDLRANGAKARPPWCRDSDDIAGWLLLKVCWSVRRDCEQVHVTARRTPFLSAERCLQNALSAERLHVRVHRGTKMQRPRSQAQPAARLAALLQS